MSSSDIENIIETCDLFKGLSGVEIKRIAAIAHIETFEAGEAIFQQDEGDFGKLFYIIAEGHVFLERSVDLGPRKGKAIISLLGKGRALGCWSSLLGESHSLMTSATCRNPVKIVAINGPSLRKMMVEDPKLGFKILERLCFILRERMQGVFGAMENI